MYTAALIAKLFNQAMGEIGGIASNETQAYVMQSCESTAQMQIADMMHVYGNTEEEAAKMILEAGNAPTAVER